MLIHLIKLLPQKLFLLWPCQSRVWRILRNILDILFLTWKFFLFDGFITRIEHVRWRDGVGHFEQVVLNILLFLSLNLALLFLVHHIMWNMLGKRVTHGDPRPTKGPIKSLFSVCLSFCPSVRLSVQHISPELLNFFWCLEQC